MKEKPFFKSKKWWSTVIAVCIPIVLKKFDIHLTLEEQTLIIVPICSYILGQGFADNGKYKNLGEEKDG
jgi:hypothetical protein